MLPTAPKPPAATTDVYRPLLALVEDTLVSSAALALHWGYSENHLSNMRRAGQRGLPFVKLPTGGIRYRMSEILASEIAGTVGPLTLDRVVLAVASCASVPAEHRAAMVEHLRAALRPSR